MTGIEYPTLTVGQHKDLRVRMSLAAQVLMGRRGLDTNKLGELLSGRRTVPNPNMRLQTDPPTIEIVNHNAVPNVIVAFSCMVAENFFAQMSPTRINLDEAPTADYWALQIDDFPAVEKAVWDAIKKAGEERRAKLAAVPPMEVAS